MKYYQNLQNAFLTLNPYKRYVNKLLFRIIININNINIFFFILIILIIFSADLNFFYSKKDEMSNEISGILSWCFIIKGEH